MKTMKKIIVSTLGLGWAIVALSACEKNEVVAPNKPTNKTTGIKPSGPNPLKNTESSREEEKSNASLDGINKKMVLIPKPKPDPDPELEPDPEPWKIKK